MKKEDVDLMNMTFEAMGLDSILSLEVTREFVAFRFPLNAMQRTGVEKAIVEALSAAREDGSVVRVSFDNLGELMFCSDVLKELLPIVKDPYYLPDRSNSARFELSNNSAIMLSRKFKDE
jgi:hypothetical protein